MACAKIKVEHRINRLYHDIRALGREAKTEDERLAFDVITKQIGCTLLWAADNFPDPRKKVAPVHEDNDQPQAAKMF